MEEETSLNLISSMRSVLAGILADEQRNTEHMSALVHKKPEKWMYAAGELMQGGSLRSVRAKTGMNYRQVKEIQSAVLFHDEAKELKKNMAMNAASDIADAAELKGRILDNILSDPNRVDELGTSEYKDLSVSQKLDSERLARLMGENVQRIEVKHVTTPDEARALIDSLPEVMEAEAIED